MYQINLHVMVNLKYDELQQFGKFSDQLSIQKQTQLSKWLVLRHQTCLEELLQNLHQEIFKHSSASALLPPVIHWGFSKSKSQGQNFRYRIPDKRARTESGDRSFYGDLSKNPTRHLSSDISKSFFISLLHYKHYCSYHKPVTNLKLYVCQIWQQIRKGKINKIIFFQCCFL